MCLPAALASGKSCSQPLEATKLEAWAPGGTFKIPLSGWKIGIFFFFFFWSAPSSELLLCLLQSRGTHEWKPRCPSERYAIRSEGSSLNGRGADVCTGSFQAGTVTPRGLQRGKMWQEKLRKEGTQLNGSTPICFRLLNVVTICLLFNYSSCLSSFL